MRYKSKPWSWSSQSTSSPQSSRTKNRKKRLNARVLAGLIAGAALPGLAAPVAWAENTGGVLDGAGNYKGSSPNYEVTIDSDVSGSVYGQEGTDSHITSGSVKITGGTVSGDVWGAYNQGDQGSVAGAAVTMTGGSARVVYGASSRVDNASYSYNEADRNVVTIGGTSRVNEVWGG